MFVFKLNSLTFLGPYLDFILLLSRVTVRQTAQLVVQEPFIFEVRIKIHKQHLLE